MLQTSKGREYMYQSAIARAWQRCSLNPGSTILRVLPKLQWPAKITVYLPCSHQLFRENIHTSFWVSSARIEIVTAYLKFSPTTSELFSQWCTAHTINFRQLSLPLVYLLSLCFSSLCSLPYLVVIMYVQTERFSGKTVFTCMLMFLGSLWNK